VSGSRAKTIGALGLVVASALASKVARAAPTARLVYSRAADAASCPDETALRKAVATRVGYDAFFPWAQRTIVAAIVRRERSFVATVDLVDEGGIDHGAHELHTDGACGDLLDAVALAVAIAIDPRSMLAAPLATTREHASPPPDAPPTPPMPPPSSLMAPPPGAAPSMPVEVRPRIAFEVGMGPVATLGMGPETALGGEVGVGLRWSRLSIGLEGLVDAPSSATAKAGKGQASAWLALGSLVPCVTVRPLFLCAVVQAGSMRASAQGDPTTSAAVSRPWFALGGRVGTLIPIRGALGLRVHLDLVADPAPTTLYLNGQEAWTAPVVAGALGIDALWRF
jgi:hypothetical protein